LENGKTQVMAAELKANTRVVVNVGSGKEPLTAKEVLIGGSAPSASEAIALTALRLSTWRSRLSCCSPALGLTRSMRQSGAESRKGAAFRPSGSDPLREIKRRPGRAFS
jgi:hypothetical protein